MTEGLGGWGGQMVPIAGNKFIFATSCRLNNIYRLLTHRQTVVHSITMLFFILYKYSITEVLMLKYKCIYIYIVIYIYIYITLFFIK
jgi:hypothetical protein